MDLAPFTAACLALSLAVAPAGASTLYKSVGPNGVIQFSDTPPSDNSMLVERRPIEALTSATAAAAASRPALMNVGQSLDGDEYLMRANAQVDMAEHALALARRSMWSELEGLRLNNHRVSASEVERVEFYKRGVVAARQNLMEALRARTAPTVLASR